MYLLIVRFVPFRSNWSSVVFVQVQFPAIAFVSLRDSALGTARVMVHGALLSSHMHPSASRALVCQALASPLTLTSKLGFWLNLDVSYLPKQLFSTVGIIVHVLDHDNWCWRCWLPSTSGRRGRWL